MRIVNNKVISLILLVFTVGIVFSLAGCATKKQVYSQEAVYLKHIPKNTKFYISPSEFTENEVVEGIKNKIKKIVANNAACSFGKVISVKVGSLTFSKMISGDKIGYEFSCKSGDEVMRGYSYFQVLALSENVYMIKMQKK